MGLEEEVSIIKELVSIGIDEYIFSKYKNKIRNKTKVISNKQLKEILNLLHKDYRHLDSKITLYEKSSQIYLDIFNRSYLQNIKHYSLTEALQFGEYISIFTFNNKENNVKKLRIIFNLFHELRHVYQMTYMDKKYLKASINYVKIGKGYSSQWIERDANAFASRMMNKNMKKINEIINCNIEWNCYYGVFFNQK